MRESDFWLDKACNFVVSVYSMLRIDCVSCQHRPVDTMVDITGTHVTYSQLVGKVCVDNI